MKKRNIAAAIILSIITFGIYGIYWFIVLTDDVKKAAGDDEFPSGAIALLYTILTIGIYGIYWAYKMGKLMKKAQKKKKISASDNSVLYLILQLLGLGVIVAALIQSDLNDMVIEKKPSKKPEIKENKSITKGIVIAVLIVVLFGILFFVSEKSNKSFEKPETFTEEEQEELKNINVDQYLAIKAGTDVAVIYIARPTCSHCEVQTPRMKYVKYKYGVEVNYLNTDEFDEEGNDYQKLASSDSFFDEGFGTPTILIVQNDKIIDSIAGEANVSSVVELFKKYGLIKK